MTEPEMPPQEIPEPKEAASRNWRPKLRWFAAEIAVVVVGVLIALALNAWWANRDARARALVVLQDLRQDFAFNKAEIERVRVRALDRMGPFNQFTSLAPETLSDLSPDSAFALYESAYELETYDPITGSIDALVASGNLGLIRDHALRNHLTSFLESIHDADEEKGAVHEMVIRAYRRTAFLGGPWGPSNSPSPVGVDELIRLRRDTEFMALARSVRFGGLYYIGELAEVEAAIDSVLVRLDANLVD